MTIFSGTKPRALGVAAGRLRECPRSPNCVCSDARESHRVGAFPLALPPADAWARVREAVAALPRTRVVTATDDYLHAECRSRMFGFIDDLELHLRPKQRVVAVRSASRVGYSDLGVNRARVDGLRAALVRRGAIAADPGAAER
jgi:uncharacterized protein (DUF1499 family)